MEKARTGTVLKTSEVKIMEFSLKVGSITQTKMIPHGLLTKERTNDVKMAGISEEQIWKGPWK